MFSQTCHMVIDCGLESLFSQALVPEALPTHILHCPPFPQHAMTPTPASQASHQPWHYRLALALPVLSALQTAPHLSCCLLQGPVHHALPGGSMGILIFLLSVIMPAVSPASSPIDPSKLEAWGKRQCWARPQLLSQSCSLPPTASPLGTDSTGPREFLRWHTVHKECFLCINETQLRKVWFHMTVHSKE